MVIYISETSCENRQPTFQSEDENYDILAIDCISKQENNDVDDRIRTCHPPNYLPVMSCFEPNDVIDDETGGYQILLEDITSLDLYEDYETLYEFPLRNLLNFQNNLNENSFVETLSPFYENEHWLKECEEILSPYSPNKAYFRLVQDLELS